MPHYVRNHHVGNIPSHYYDFVPPPQQHVEQRDDERRRCVSPTTHDTVAYVTSNDVLCGRGAPSIHHPGNQYFRSLVKARQEEYASLRRPDKSVIVREILQLIENRQGRFLRQVGTGEWVEVHEAIRYEKTCQALREFQKTRNKARIKRKAAS